MYIDRTVFNIKLECLIYAKYKVPILTFSILQIFDKLETLIPSLYSEPNISTSDLWWELLRLRMEVAVYSFQKQIHILLTKNSITY